MAGDELLPEQKRIQIPCLDVQARYLYPLLQKPTSVLKKSKELESMKNSSSSLE
jgi:hypothetical protein